MDVAKRLAWTAEFLTGAQALKAGLVDAVSDNPVTFALEHAARLVIDSDDTPGDVKRRMLLDRQNNRFHIGPRSHSAVDTTVLSSHTWNQHTDDVGGQAKVAATHSRLLEVDGALGPAFPTLLMPACGALPAHLLALCRALGADRRVRGVIVRVTASSGGGDISGGDGGGSGRGGHGADPGEVADALRSLPVPVIVTLSRTTCDPDVSRALLGADVRFGPSGASMTLANPQLPRAQHPPQSQLDVDVTRMQELYRCDSADDRAGSLTRPSTIESSAYFTQVDDPAAEARSLALQLLRRSPDSIAAVKALFHRTVSARGPLSAR